MNPVSVSEAAGILGVSPARVRALVVDGGLPATKIANRWLVERGEVEKRLREAPPRGRPFSPRNAWALLLIASGEPPRDLEPSLRSRLRRALKQEGLKGLRARLGARAHVKSYRAHPGEVSHLLGDETLVRSGISAVGGHGIGLVSGREADGYLAVGSLDDFVARHALAPAQEDANVQLRVVSDEAWFLVAGRALAPRAAVALDLAEDPDARSAQAGRDALLALDREGIAA